MARTQIGSLYVKLTANSSPLERVLHRASGVVKSFGRGITSIAGRVLNLRSAILGLAGVGGLGYLIQQSFSSIDVLAKTSSKLGIATEKLAGFHLAAKLGGVEVRTFNMALQRMLRRMSEAAHDTGEAKAAIKELTLDARKLGTMTPTRKLLILADAFAKVRNTSDKLRLAFKLFDSEGVAMVNVLGRGRKALEETMRQTRQFGTALSRIDAAKVEAANDAMSRFREMIRGIAVQIDRHLAPFVGAFADYLVDVGTSGTTMGAKVSAAFAGVHLWIASGLDLLERMANKVYRVRDAMVDLWDKVKGFSWDDLLPSGKPGKGGRASIQAIDTRPWIERAWQATLEATGINAIRRIGALRSIARAKITVGRKDSVGGGIVGTPGMGPAARAIKAVNDATQEQKTWGRKYLDLVEEINARAERIAKKMADATKPQFEETGFLGSLARAGAGKLRDRPVIDAIQKGSEQAFRATWRHQQEGWTTKVVKNTQQAARNTGMIAKTVRDLLGAVTRLPYEIVTIP